MLRIAGLSGIGKTSIAEALAERARSEGWILVFIEAHRIQEPLPLHFAGRVLDRLIGALGAESARYTSGLPERIDIDQRLLRVLEAALIDRPVLIVADDAQWADAESRTLLLRLLQALADRPLVLLSTERSDEIEGPAFDFSDVAIIVEELDRASSEALARKLLPTASREIIQTISEHAHGRAIDIVALAQATVDPTSMTIADVMATQRALIARELTSLATEEREFLQVCSLISDPIEFGLLRRLWPDEGRLIHLTERFSGRYLIQKAGALYFVHASIAQSVRETVALEIPYRRRIFEALASLPIHRLEDLERMVDQARGMGDEALEQTQLQRVYDEASRLQVKPAMARALERLLEIVPFNGNETLSLYGRLAMLYNGLSRDGDTHRVCTEALTYALDAGIRDGLGLLVLQDLFALFFRGEREAYNQTVARFGEYFSSPSDRAFLAIAKLFIATCDYDDASYQKALAEYEAIGLHDAKQDVRIKSFGGFHVARRGDSASGFRMFDEGRASALIVDPLLTSMLSVGRALMSFQELGNTHPQTTDAVQELRRDADAGAVAYFAALNLLLTNQHSDTIEVVAEALVHEQGVYGRRQLLGVAATAAILSKIQLAPALRSAMIVEGSLSLRDRTAGSQLSILVAVASWEHEKKRASKRLRMAVDFLKERPPEPMVVVFPIAFVEVAKALEQHDVLEAIERGELKHDELAFNIAQFKLARFAARASLGRKLDRNDLVSLKHDFESLGAPYFASYSSRLIEDSAAAAGPGGKLTRREREVTGLVAEGQSNREIAEKLVLSERTVEAHIANIFAKVGVSSRAQLAVWSARSGLVATLQ